MMSRGQAASDLPHVRDASVVPRVLHLIESSTRPHQVSARHLTANGFDATESKGVVRLLKALGLVDDSGAPTDRWDDYRRSADRATVLAGWVRESYAPLLVALPEGAGDDTVAAEAVAQLNCSPEVARRVAATLRALSAAAGLSAGEDDQAELRPRRAVIDDVSRLMQVSVAEFETARACLTVERSRPAVVAAWNSYAAMAIAHLSGDDFAVVRGSSPRRRSMTVSELAVRTPGRELIDQLAQEKLIDADDEQQLIDMLRLRNDCAHPTTAVPTRAEAADYLSAILTLSGSLAEKSLI